MLESLQHDQSMCRKPTHDHYLVHSGLQQDAFITDQQAEIDSLIDEYDNLQDVVRAYFNSPDTAPISHTNVLCYRVLYAKSRQRVGSQCI